MINGREELVYKTMPSEGRFETAQAIQECLGLKVYSDSKLQACHVGWLGLDLDLDSALSGKQYDSYLPITYVSLVLHPCAVPMYTTCYLSQLLLISLIFIRYNQETLAWPFPLQGGLKPFASKIGMSAVLHKRREV